MVTTQPNCVLVITIVTSSYNGTGAGEQCWGCEQCDLDRLLDDLSVWTTSQSHGMHTCCAGDKMTVDGLRGFALLKISNRGCPIGNVKTWICPRGEFIWIPCTVWTSMLQ